jgi:predicted alpha/beta superfamily hydrolase
VATEDNVTKLIVGFVAVFLASTPTASSAVETQFLQGLGDTRYQRVDSEIVGRPYHIYVMLPDRYEQFPGEKYPTIYVLDGGMLFPLLTAYYRYLNLGDEIPAAIIVGISYGSSSFAGGNYRSTDFTAQSAEREYRGAPGSFRVS